LEEKKRGDHCHNLVSPLKGFDDFQFVFWLGAREDQGVHHDFVDVALRQVLTVRSEKKERKKSDMNQG
jgi:hypothetical protein